MKIQESQGIRTYGRGLRSILLAKRLTREDLGYLADVAESLGHSYQSVERVLPFEHDGFVYRIVSDAPTKPYRKTKRVVAELGRLEDFPPARAARKPSLEAKIDARVGELAQWTNIFALREEARRYMDARLEAIEVRLEAIEARLFKIELAQFENPIDISA